MFPASDTKKTLVVTGANGYIGRAVVVAARRAGYRVNALVRTPAELPADKGIKAFAWTFNHRPQTEALTGAAAVIHLAVDLATATGADDDPNIVALGSLRDAATVAGVPRFLFVSSQSASPTAISGYGRSKWRAETMLTAETDLIVRPGLVYGGSENGFYGLLCRIVDRLPIIPLIRPDAPLQPIQVDELADALVWLAVSPVVSRLFCLGTPRPVRSDDFMRHLGRQRSGRTPRILPLPTGLIVLAVGFAACFLPSLRFLDERLRGLVALAPMASADSLRALPPRIRPRSGGPPGAPAASTRRLLAEARALLAAGHGVRPNHWDTRRYVRVLSAGAEPLGLPTPILWWPFLMRFVEPMPFLPVGAIGAEFRRRFHFALVAGEILYPPKPRQRRSGWSVVVALVGLSFAEALTWPSRHLFHLLWWRR